MELEESAIREMETASSRMESGSTSLKQQVEENRWRHGQGRSRV